jgi:hypothetical protein
MGLRPERPFVNRQGRQPLVMLKKIKTSYNGATGGVDPAAPLGLK